MILKFATQRLSLSLIGLLCGLVFYSLLSVLSFFASPISAEGMTTTTLSAALGLTLVAAGSAWFVLIMDKAWGFAMTVTTLVVSAVVIASPTPNTPLDTPTGIVELLQPGARLGIAPTLAAALLIVAITSGSNVRSRG